MFREISETVLHEAYLGAGEDAHGNDVKSWASPVEVGVYAFDPGGTSEPRNPGGDRVIVEPTVYMSEQDVFAPMDRVTARGDTYDVDGETRLWVHPTDATRRANVVTLRRADG